MNHSAVPNLPLIISRNVILLTSVRRWSMQPTVTNDRQPSGMDYLLISGDWRPTIFKAITFQVTIFSPFFPLSFATSLNTHNFFLLRKHLWNISPKYPVCWHVQLNDRCPNVISLPFIRGALTVSCYGASPSNFPLPRRPLYFCADIFSLKHESSIFRSFIQPCMWFW